MSFGPIITTSYWPPPVATSFSTAARSVFSSSVTNFTLMLGLLFSNPPGVSCSIVVINGFDTVATVIVTGPDPDELDPDEQAVKAFDDMFAGLFASVLQSENPDGGQWGPASEYLEASS